MATTNPVAAIAILDALGAAGIEFAVLHGEEQAAAGEVTSDVDVVVRERPIDVLRATAQELSEAQLFPIIHWRYDIADTATVFFATADASDGVQVDFLCDPLGVGKYGLSSSAVLHRAVPGERWRRINPLDEDLYLLRKRNHKQDFNAARTQVAKLWEYPSATVESAAKEIFSPMVAEETLALLAVDAEPDRQPPQSRGHYLYTAQRWMERFRYPTGYWVELMGSDSRAEGEALATRFGRFLPRIGSSARPRPPKVVRWWLHSVAPIRWRPGVFVSWTAQPAWPRPDLAVHDVTGEPNHTARQVVHAMCARLL